MEPAVPILLRKVDTIVAMINKDHDLTFSILQLSLFFINTRALSRVSISSNVVEMRRNHLPILKPDHAEIVDLNDFESLADGVKDKFYPILRELYGEIIGQGVSVTVRDLHPLDVANMALD